MAELRMSNLSEENHPEMVAVFQEITGADARHTTPEIGLEFTGKSYVLRWSGFKVITDEEAIRLLKTFQNDSLQIELR